MPNFIAGKAAAAEMRGADPDDNIVGWYVNRRPGVPDIAVGEKALYLGTIDDSITQTIAYHAIAEIILHDRPSKDATRIYLQMNEGQDILLPILGSRGKFFDSYEFTRFLMRVIGRR